MSTSEGAPETSAAEPEARSGGTHPAADAATHDAFWRSSFTRRPYVDTQLGYQHYRPAFRFGWESHARRPDVEFDDVEESLEARWEDEPRRLSWNEARPAVRDAWKRAARTRYADPGSPLV